MAGHPAALVENFGFGVQHASAVNTIEGSCVTTWSRCRCVHGLLAGALQSLPVQAATGRSAEVKAETWEQSHSGASVGFDLAASRGASCLSRGCVRMTRACASCQ